MWKRSSLKLVTRNPELERTMATDIVRVGLGQIRVADVETNVRKHIEFIEGGREKGLDLVCFPEAAVSGYYKVHYNRPEEVDWDAVDKGIRRIGDATRSAGVGAVVGSAVKRPDGIRNSAFLFSKDGEQLGEYVKCQLMPSDAECYVPGRGVELYQFESMPVGLQICYDQRFPELWRVLAVRGAKVIFHGSNACTPEGTWKIPVVEAHLRSRAAENGVYVVSVNAGGPFQNWGSVIYDPIGLEIARASYDREELVAAEIDLTKVSRRFIEERRTDLAEVVEKRSEE